MEHKTHPASTDAPADATGARPQLASCDHAGQDGTPPALDPAAQRLHYLFRRFDANDQPHVLKNALFEYRGIKLP